MRSAAIRHLRALCGPAARSIAFVCATALAVVPYAHGASEIPVRTKAWRIGFLHTGTLGSAEVNAVIEPVRRGLAERGFVEGRNLVIEYRGAGGRIERLDDLAKDLVQANVDLIFAVATPPARAARRATSTIPIVAAAMGDPVGDGLVASLARPGANLTGTTFWGPKLVGKHVELVRDALPGATDVGVLWHRGAYVETTMDAMLREADAAAREAGIRLHFVGVDGPDELDAAFERFARQRASALVVFPSPLFFSQRSRVVALTRAHRLPALFNNRDSVELGALLSYGPNLTELLHESTDYVERILRGARPATLPVRQPIRLELVVNRKAATSLGVSMPPAMLARADTILD